MSEQVLVAGIGNIFNGDDGFGSETARRLQSYPLPEGVVVVDYGIRGMHLAYDLLEGYRALIIIDAAPIKGSSPGDINVIEVGPEDLGTGDFDAHGMEPTAVLSSLGSLGGALPPTYVIGCEPADLSERIGLSAPVAAAVDRAVEVFFAVLEEQLGIPRDPLSVPSTHFVSSAHESEPEGDL